MKKIIVVGIGVCTLLLLMVTSIETIRAQAPHTCSFGPDCQITGCNGDCDVTQNPDGEHIVSCNEPGVYNWKFCGDA